MNLCYRLAPNCTPINSTAAAGAQQCTDPVALCNSCHAELSNPAIDCRRCAPANAQCAIAGCERLAVIDVTCIENQCATKISCCDHHIANRCNAHASGVCSCKKPATLTLSCFDENCDKQGSGCPECYGPPLFLDTRCTNHNKCALCNISALGRYVACNKCRRAFLACNKCSSRQRTNKHDSPSVKRQKLINAGICPQCNELADAWFDDLLAAARMPPLVYIEAATTFCNKEVAPEEEWRIPVQHADALARQMNEISKRNGVRHKNGERGFDDKSYDMDLETVETCLCVTIMRETKESGHWIWLVVTHNCDRNTDVGTPFRRIIYDLREYVMGDNFAQVRQWYFNRGATRIVYAAPQTHPMLYYHRISKTSRSDWVVLDATGVDATVRRDVWASGLYQGSTRKEQKEDTMEYVEDISDVSDSENEENKKRKREERWLYKKTSESFYAKKKQKAGGEEKKVDDQKMNEEQDDLGEDDDDDETAEAEDGNGEEAQTSMNEEKRESRLEIRAREFGEKRGYQIRVDKMGGSVFIDKDNKDSVNLHHAEVRGGAFAQLLGAQLLGIAATKGCCPKCQKTFEKSLHLVCFDRQKQDRYNEYRNRRTTNDARFKTIDEVLEAQQLKRHAVAGGGMCFFHSAAKLLGNGDDATALRNDLGTWLKTANDNQLLQLFDAEKDEINDKLGCDSLASYAAHLEGNAGTWGYSVTVAALAKRKNLRLTVLVWNEEGVDEHAVPIGRISKTDTYGPNHGTPACVINTRPLYFADHFEPVTPGDNQLDGRTNAVDGTYARQYT